MRLGPLPVTWLWRLIALLLLALLMLAQLPANLVSRWIADASRGHIQLSHTHGTVWHGSGTLAIHGPSGAGLALPQRVQWSLSAHWAGIRPQLQLKLLASCCMQEPYVMAVGRMEGFWGLKMHFTDSRWPLEVLQGLGSPWNSIRVAGMLQIKSADMRLNWADATLEGVLPIVIDNLQVAMAPGQTVGRFDLLLGHAQITKMSAGIPVMLSTQQGPLMLEGQGHWTPARGISFKGTAHAEPSSKDRLQGLLTLLGEPQGDRHRLEWTHGS